MQGGQADGTITRTDREGSVDDSSDSAMLDSRPSGPLIQDPSGVYPYGSGTPPPPPHIHTAPLFSSFMFCCQSHAPLLFDL